MKGIGTVDRTERTPSPEDTPIPEPESIPREFDHPRLELALGLLTPAHRQRLGPALHAYLVFLSQRRPYDYPWVGGRDPKTKQPMVNPLSLLAAIHQVSERTMRAWIWIMEKGGYVHTEVVRSGFAKGSGLRIRILKAKHWRKGRMRVIPDPSVKRGSGKKSPDQSGKKSPDLTLQPAAAQHEAGSLPQEDKIHPSNKNHSLVTRPWGTVGKKRSQGDKGKTNQPKGAA